MSIVNLELKHSAIDKLKQEFEFESDGIEEYVKNRLFIVNDLLGAAEQIKSVFKKPIKLSLKNTIDPEDASDNLFVVIRSKCSPKQSFNKLKQIFDNSIYRGFNITHRPL